MRLSTQFNSPTKSLKHMFSAACLGAGLLMVQAASATTVQFQTVLGDIEVNLFDKGTPETVKNFLAYVNANVYTNTIIHRSMSGFMVQGGGFKYTGELPMVAIPQIAKKVVNEPVYSNLRGTIAMAKLDTDANSATNQWFFNLSNDNAPNLDKQNGGFTVFGQVIGGMEVVDSIAALNRFNMKTPFEAIPLRNYTTTDNINKVPVTGDHLMLIENIVVLNADPDTAASLNPTKNTLINKKDGGGGSMGLISLLMLGVLALGRKSLLNRK